MSSIYGSIVARRGKKFEAGVGVRRFAIPVISVGNLSVGGTGKTPMVRTIVRWLVQDGRRPAIAMRGYKSRHASADRGGERGGGSDEAREYRGTLPPWVDGAVVPIVARPDRAAGLDLLLQSVEGRLVDRIVLDDGFQHRQIARDLDIVLIDATRDPWSDRLLPEGWLREDVRGLRRAQAIVVTHAEAVGAADVERLVEKAGASVEGGAIVAVSRHRWIALRASVAGETGVQDVSMLEDKRVLAVCAIGNPGAFLSAAQKACRGELAGRVVLRDHDPYREGTVRRIIGLARSSRAEVILTTEKDWTKLACVEAGRWPAVVVRPVLEMSFDRGEADLRAAVGAV